MSQAYIPAPARVNAPEDCGLRPGLPLHVYVAAEAWRLRDRGDDAGRLMAEALEGLVRELRCTDATTAEDHADRLATLDRDYAGRETPWWAQPVTIDRTA